MSIITETICDDGDSLLGMNEPTASLEVFPFRYRDARTGKWVNARYKATHEEIAARCAEWEITGPGEERRPSGGYFNPAPREEE